MNTLSKWGRIVAIAGGITTSSATVGYGTVKLLGVETVKDHTTDVNKIKSDQAEESKIVRGMLECVMRGIQYEHCPAVKADLLRP